MTSPSQAIDRLFQRYVALAERRTALLLALLAGLAAAALVVTLGLELHTDLAELLPESHPAVQALRRISGRQKSSTNLVVLLESPDADANRRFAELLRPELDRLVPSVFSEIQWAPDQELPAFAQRWQWLYADRADLERAESLLDRLIAKRSSPLSVDLDDEDPEAELARLRARLDQKLPPAPAGDRAKNFIGQEEGRWFLGVLLWRRGDGLATSGDRETMDAVRAVIDRLQPKKIHPGLEVHLTGNIAMALEEHDAVRDDLTLATVVCTLSVLLVIFLYFRRIAVLWVIGAPAVLGLLLSLAMARLTVHYLNANTAFLISIILGNGINSPIVLMARFGEERRGGAPVGDSLRVAMRSTLLATGTAMIAASIAYGSLLATSFRGFNQFGLVGGAGMLLVWIFSFLLVPPMVIFGEGLKPNLLTPRANLFARPFRWIGLQGERRPVALVVATLALVAGAAVPMARWLRDPMEWNFSNLRSSYESVSERNWHKMLHLGMGNIGAGPIATDGVLLVDRPEQAEPVAEALRRQDASFGEQRLLKEVRTLSSVLPRDQADKLAILARIRKQIDRHVELMSDEERALAERFRPPDALRTITVADLPRQVRDAFTEVDGEVGRLVGIDADPARFSDWNGHDLLRLARSMRVTTLGKTWVVAAPSTVFGGMLETILHDGPKVTLIALVGVLLLVVSAFGPRGAAPVIGALLIGMVWLGGLLSLLQMKLNFVNFVAVPITLGIGTDYAANIWARVREGGASIATVVAETGSAVALCSATTIIGYSSLLLARNRALNSFGMLADLGEVTCLAAALIALPAFVTLLARRRSAAR